MRYRRVVAAGLLVLSLQAPAVLSGLDETLPVKDGRPAVATVNGEAIAFDEFVQQLDPPVDTARLNEGRATPAELALLDRMIVVRLIVQEAATMGLGDLPEIRKQVDVQSRQILRDVLTEHAVKDVRADETAVERQYKELVKEYRTASLLFANADTARKFRDEIGRGADYGEAAARATAAKIAKAEGDDAYHPSKDYLPEIAEALARLEAGQVSPAIKLQAGLVIVRVVDVRYPEDAVARAEARRMVLARQRQAAFAAYEDRLHADHIVIHHDVLKTVDYEAKEPGIEALLKDTRVVAEIKGASPVTVGDLTEYLRLQFFHGGDTTGQGRRMNSRKRAALDATLSRRVLNMEGERLALDKSPAYIDRVGAFEDSLVFDGFVQKVIAPDSKLKDEDVKAYYAAHLKDYSSPEMIRLRSLAFTARSAAEEAIRKLRDGAEFGWVASTAEGQADKSDGTVLTFDGRPVTTDSMPAGLQKTLAGAKAGDFKLYGSPEGPFHVLAVQDVVASTARPFDDVKTDIANTLYAERLTKGIEEYARKLRAQSAVETYLMKAE